MCCISAVTVVMVLTWGFLPIDIGAVLLLHLLSMSAVVAECGLAVHPANQVLAAGAGPHSDGDLLGLEGGGLIQTAITY